MPKPPLPKPTGAQIHVEKYMRQGDPAGRAIAKTIDLFNDQHWYDRDRYGDLIRGLAGEMQELRDRVAALDTARV